MFTFCGDFSGTNNVGRSSGDDKLSDDCDGDGGGGGVDDDGGDRILQLVAGASGLVDVSICYWIAAAAVSACSRGHSGRIRFSVSARSENTDS